MNEQEFVAGEFQKAFSKWRQDPFVLYGLGKNTEAVLERTKGFRFVGLMDSRNTGREFWGLRVLSEEEVIDRRPRIVIIARESVVPVIYERIAHLHREYGLEIYNFRGERPGEAEGQGNVPYANRDLPYWNVAEEDLRRAIDGHECISFDIFDTLLMRRVLEPENVFGIAERILEEKGYKENHFRERRIAAERELVGYPKLKQIYEELGREYHISEGVLEEWRRIEIAVEDSVIVPRRKMREIFAYALEQGKRVFLVSDMYFTADELGRILRRHGIEGFEGLLVSCCYGKGKADGSLYEVYKELAEGSSYLHIGDNRRSDGERARERGIDAFQVYSAYEMWMASSMQTTLAHAESLEQKCILGNLVWRCCENPFALHETRGLLAVDSPETLGYVFLGALYDEFALWLRRAVEESGAEQLLLPSRDGFLIARLLEGEEMSFEPLYFKASRRAVSVASIRSAEDILLLAERGFQGTFGELLLQRFGVAPKEKDAGKELPAKGSSAETLRDYCLSYQEEILKHAERERRSYLSYLDTLGLRNAKKQVIFDFVASGTVQYYMSKLLDKELKGIYFATMNHPHEKYGLDGRIVSAYGNISSYDAGNNVAKHYLFLETIMVDGCPTLKCVEDGDFVYESGTHSEFQTISRVQDGILRYCRDMKEMRKLIPGWRGERNFADELFGKLFSGSCQVAEGLAKVFVNDDIFDGVAGYRVWGE